MGILMEVPMSRHQPCIRVARSEAAACALLVRRFRLHRRALATVPAGEARTPAVAAAEAIVKQVSMRLRTEPPATGTSADSAAVGVWVEGRQSRVLGLRGLSWVRIIVMPGAWAPPAHHRPTRYCR